MNESKWMKVTIPLNPPMMNNKIKPTDRKTGKQFKFWSLINQIIIQHILQYIIILSHSIHIYYNLHLLRHRIAESIISKFFSSNIIQLSLTLPPPSISVAIVATDGEDEWITKSIFRGSYAANRRLETRWRKECGRERGGSGRGKMDRPIKMFIGWWLVATDRCNTRAT